MCWQAIVVENNSIILSEAAYAEEKNLKNLSHQAVGIFNRNIFQIVGILESVQLLCKAYAAAYLLHICAAKLVGYLFVLLICEKLSHTAAYLLHICAAVCDNFSQIRRTNK